MSLKRHIFFLFMALAMSASAEVVHVYTQKSIGGDVTALSDVTQETGAEYTTAVAPAVYGYIFTQWTSSDEQGFVQRDVFGRAHDAAKYHLYQSITLTANYLPEKEDSDKDGVADGWEIYWYGDLSKDGNVDSDGDGYTFAQELAAGTDPLMPDRSILGGIDWRNSNVELYNPHGYEPLTIRCEPEGTLFETKIEYHSPGETISGPTVSHNSSTFAYWTTNGVRVADAFGRALDTVVFKMPKEAVELVAVCEEDETKREKLYWYGRDVADDSDSDGDGYTFAQELAAGTDPLMPDRSILGGIDWRDSSLWEYNPYGYSEYIIRSDPEGVLFATQSDTVAPGSVISTPPVSKESGFAYWTLNGKRMADALGRAVDSVKVTASNNEKVELIAVVVDNVDERERMYWYGREIAKDSDTDGDGYTFAQELAAGTDPLMPDRSILGGIDWRDSNQAELNLQPYEQVQGAVVNGAFEQLFTSPIAGNTGSSATFGEGGAVWPVVADVNGDGKWDLVVCCGEEKGTKGTEGTSSASQSLKMAIYLNVGSAGNPEFVVGENVSIPPSVDLAMNSTDKLAALTLDVAPINALSATTNGATLLVSDTEGRIWFYEGLGVSSQGLGVSGQELGVSGQELGVSGQGLGVSGQELGVSGQGDNSKLQTLNYQLKHKVWGGSYAGFANGLRLAAVDWEDDGDLDCLCGTAEGKLMLLRNPKVGRPTNLKALAGVDNVLLTWDPNQQSRIRGYKVYREEGSGNGYVALVPGVPNVSTMYTTALPRYRDFPGLTNPNLSYKVSSISRFYTAGNSTPTITESPATEAVRAELGTVKFFWNDVVCKLGDNANVMLSIENSMNYDVADKTLTVKYNLTYLRPLKIAKTGLTEGCEIEETKGTKETEGTRTEGTGEWKIVFKSGKLPAGGGKFLTFVFETLKEGTTTVGCDSNSLGIASSTTGSATVLIAAPDPENPTDVPPYSLGDINGDGKLTQEDVRELARLKNGNGRKYTQNQLKAGDFNGNGKLDNADYQALREMLKDIGVNIGGK